MPATTVAELFGANELTEEEALYQRKKRALVKLDESTTTTTTTTTTTAATSATTNNENKSSVVSSSSGASSSNVKGEVAWARLERDNVIQRRVAPWIAARIREALGDDDAMFVSFVCEQLAARVSQQQLVDALAPVLDSDTTAFVSALWRQLLSIE